MSAAPAGAPARLGYRMPAEWEPHAATWIAWPHERSDWPGPGKLEAVRWVYTEFVRHVAAGERVRLLVRDVAMARQARGLLRRAGAPLAQVDFVQVPTDRSWTRDFCPLWVRGRDGGLGLVHWRFNGWAKYPNHRRDAAVPNAIARAARLPRWKPTVEIGGRARHLVLEGGGIDVNGRGTLLTTEECLLSPIQARNPGLDRRGVERVLGDWLGVRKVLWLGEGITGDDTHGHVDDLARFVDPTTVVVASSDDPRDPDYARLRENRERLRRMTDQDGTPLRVRELPMPAPVTWEGERLPASYANFYVANAVVVVPTFNDPNDRRALALLAECFPDRRVLGIHAVDLVLGLGTLHCMTQQEPAATTPASPWAR
ncbi:MAG: agmatine deiminase family protein [bacterium]|nr:agmatine deiminase family protein [bacterium]